MTTEDNTTNPFLEHIIRILRENPQKQLYTLERQRYVELATLVATVLRPGGCARWPAHCSTLVFIIFRGLSIFVYFFLCAHGC